MGGGIYDDLHFVSLIAAPLSTLRTFSAGQVMGSLTLAELSLGTLYTPKVIVARDTKHLGVVTTFGALHQVGMHPLNDLQSTEQNIAQMAANCDQSLLIRLVLFDHCLADQLKCQSYPFPIVTTGQLLFLNPWSGASLSPSISPIITPQVTVASSTYLYQLPIVATVQPDHLTSENGTSESNTDSCNSKSGTNK